MSLKLPRAVTASIILPPPLLAKVKKIAKSEGRSFASQVRIVLEKFVEETK